VTIDGAISVRILDPRFADQMVNRFDGPYASFKSLLDQRQGELRESMQGWTRYAPIGIPVIFLVAVLLVVTTSRILRADFVRPMATVKEGALIISGGHLEHRIPMGGVAEVSEIAESINRMAGDLARSRDALVEHERQAALGALVPVVAHNIRNPLASVRAAAQMLDEHATREDIREGREAIITTIDRLGRWVNALVSYLHPLKPSLRAVRMAELVEAALAANKARMQEKGLSVVRENWAEDHEVQVDPDLMEQALSGLIANAVDASPHGAVLRVRFEASAGVFSAHIIDAGPGIPFSPQPGSLEPGPSTKRFGTGLGIPVAFKICHSHGWDLEFNTAAGGGTDVAIHIPSVAAYEVRDEFK
jgi:signal transduction histidine kinase